MTQLERVTVATAYLRPAIEWAVRFSLDGPGWLPRWARRLPLSLCAGVVLAHCHIDRLTH